MPEDLRSKVHRALEKRWLTQQAEQLRQERDRNLLECANEKSRTVTILNCLSEGLIATNRTGQIVLMNPMAMNIIRPKIVPVIGRTVSGLLGNPDLEQQISETLDTVARTVSVKRMEIPTSDGRTLQSHISPIIDDRGECLGTVTVLLDITQDKKLEKIKSDFVRLVSHELKSPVAAIAGYLNLIVDGLTARQPEKEKDIIVRSRDKANSLLDLINDLLDLSRADREQRAKTMSPLDIVPILQEAVQFYQNEALKKRIALELSCANTLPPVLGEGEELSRVFANLISNAIKYTPEDGRVRVLAETREAQIVISIADTGMGISSEEQKKVFDEFFRGRDAVAGKIAGTGLGLAIAKKIVEAHRGYLELESQLHKGSTFRVILPIAETRTV
jgi:two-component system phosphate regulon sensor histidine kinase PhoR